MTKRVCPNGHVCKDKSALKCAQCGADLPPVPKRKKTGLFILGGIVVLAIIIAAANGGKTPDVLTETIAEPRATTAPKATQAPTATLSPQDALIAVCKKYHPGSAVEGVYVPATTTEPTVFEAAIEVKTIVTAKGAINLCTTNYLKAAEAAFALDPELSLFACVYETPFTDASGTEKVQGFLRIELSRATAEKITWKNILPCGLAKIADTWYVHPSMEAEWAAACQ